MSSHPLSWLQAGQPEEGRVNDARYLNPRHTVIGDQITGIRLFPCRRHDQAQQKKSSAAASAAPLVEPHTELLVERPAPASGGRGRELKRE
jgi:hypothetical protein